MQQMAPTSATDFVVVGWAEDGSTLSLESHRSALMQSEKNPRRALLRQVQLTSNHNHCLDFITSHDGDVRSSVPMDDSDAWTEHAKGIDAARQREKHEARAAVLFATPPSDPMEDDADPPVLNLTMQSPPLLVDTNALGKMPMPHEEQSPTSVDAFLNENALGANKERKERTSSDSVIGFLS